MVVLANTFEGGSNTTAITAGNSGGTSGNAFDFASPACTYSSTHAMHGTLSAQVTTTTAATAELQWHASLGTQATVWFRAYCYFTAAPGATWRVFNVLDSGAASCATLSANTAGKLIFSNAAGTTILTSNVFPTGAWFRVEGFVVPSTTVGQLSYSVWSTSPDSNGAADDTQTSAASQVLAASIGYANFAQSSSVASVGPWWADDVGVSSTGYLGSSNAGASPNAGLAAATGVPPALNDSVVIGMTIQGV